MGIEWSDGEGLSILDFDIENRPLSYLGPDYTTAEVTAIAAGWTDEDRVHCWCLGEHSQESMLSRFLDFYNEADMVTGHYILRHDLPIINGALMEHGMGSLEPRLVSDTKVHLTKRKYLSASQESLAAMFGLGGEKFHMTQDDWRESNRLTSKGVELTKRRVTGDVKQHKELRARLVELGLLKPPRVWRPK